MMQINSNSNHYYIQEQNMLYALTNLDGLQFLLSMYVIGSQFTLTGVLRLERGCKSRLYEQCTKPDGMEVHFTYQHAAVNIAVPGLHSAH